MPTAPIPISQTWAGDLPVAALNQLPAALRDTGVGFIRDPQVLTSLVQAIRPNPEGIRFDPTREMVVFVRNTAFYNRIRIGSFRLDHGVMEIIALETRAARPITDTVAIALAVVSTEGVRELKTGVDSKIPLDLP